METKSTIRRVRSSELRPVKPKAEFTLFGKVVKVSEKTNSVLVEKGGSTTTFWMSCDENINTLEIGRKYEFTITFSSYVAKSDSTFVTLLNILRATPLDDEANIEEGFVVGHTSFNIQSSLKTKIPGLYVLTAARLKDGEEMETYYFKYFNKEKLHTDLGSAIIRFTLQKSKDIIDHKGEIWSDLEKRTFTNSDGEEVTVENPLYKPCLSILEIIR